jgi:predicted HTH transcriptional regulator
MEAYLSPERPQWSPKDEAEVHKAVTQGWIAESHHIDVKREVGDSPDDRKETARDLASFAIDGGALLIGVEEDKANWTFSLAPQPLDGLMERLEQVAAFVVDPPLTIIPEEIPSSDDSTSGYLLVQVPPSSSAPHMVGGQYFGRGERTRRQLSDAEVLRLHARHRSAEDEGARL